MVATALKTAEQNGFEYGRMLVAVFVIRSDAEYQAKVQLGMREAQRQNLTLETGAAFVSGFVNGLDSKGQNRAAALSLEDKLDKFLENELDRRLGNGADTQRGSGNPE